MSRPHLIRWAPRKWTMDVSCLKSGFTCAEALVLGEWQAAVKFISWLLEKQEAWRPSSDEADDRGRKEQWMMLPSKRCRV